MWEFVYNTVSARGHEYLHFDPALFEGRVSKVCSLFTWILEGLDGGSCKSVVNNILGN